MAMLKHNFSGLREADIVTGQHPNASSEAASVNASQPVLLKLNTAAERHQERAHPFADNYRKFFDVADDDLFLIKKFTMDTVSDPQRDLEYYDFIHRLADGTFVARYMVLSAEHHYWSDQNYRLYWKYDGNNRKLLQADLPKA